MRISLRPHPGGPGRRGLTRHTAVLVVLAVLVDFLCPGGLRGLAGSGRSLHGQAAAAAASAGQATGQATGQTGLLVRCPTEQADVYIDGEVAGKTPLAAPLPLSPGEHTIRVSRPGYTPFIDVFKVKNGQVTKLDVEILPISGVLRVTVKGGGEGRVFVDDRYSGPTPLEAEVPTGSHAVRVERYGYFPESFSVSSVAGQVIEREVDLKQKPAELMKPQTKWYQKWWVWTLGAVGVAAVATAVIVPVVLSKRDFCEVNTLDVCATNVQGLSGLGTPSAPASSQGLGLRIAF